MHSQTFPIDIDTEHRGETLSHVVNSYRPAPVVLKRDAHKSEVWARLKNCLERIGIPPISIDSLALMPLVETALDDGVITAQDKERILAAMKSLRLLTSGIDPTLKYLWDAFNGRTAFLIVWTVYLRDVVRSLPPKERVEFKTLTIESCRFMYRTIGGFLRARDLENRILVAIENAFEYRMA